VKSWLETENPQTAMNEKTEKTEIFCHKNRKMALVISKMAKTAKPEIPAPSLQRPGWENNWSSN